jgi:hypothetical protein
MRKQSLRILLALLGFAALGAAAKAQVLDQIVVNIPFEFVAGGKTLPAGTYKATRVSASGDRFEGLLLINFDNHVSVMVLPNGVEDSRSEKAQLSFKRVGGQHFLSKIETGDNLYNIEISHAAPLLASSPALSGVVSGSAGSN